MCKINNFTKFNDKRVLSSVIDRAIYRAITQDRYIVGVLVSNTKYIDKLWKLAENTIEFWDAENVLCSSPKIRRNQNETLIQFLNGSTINFLKANQAIRGHLFHEIIVDKSIEKEVVEAVVYPKVVPYPVNPEKMEFGICSRDRECEIDMSCLE